MMRYQTILPVAPMDDHPLRIIPASDAYEEAVTAAIGIDREGFPGHDHAYPDDPTDYRCQHQTFIPRLAEREAEALAESVHGESRRYQEVLYRSLDDAKDALTNPRLLVGGYDPDAVPDDPDDIDPETFNVDDQYRERELLLSADLHTDAEMLDDLRDAVASLPYDVLGWDVMSDQFTAYTTPQPAIDQLGDAKVGLHAHVAARGLRAPAVVGIASGRHPSADTVHATMVAETGMLLTPDMMDDREQTVYDDIVETLDLYGLHE